jgi:lipid-A-disaccharide synthase
MIIISALDNSGQLYAADLVRELKRRMPNQTFIGIGGHELAAAGCELVHDISDSSAMLTGVIGALKWAIPAFKRLKHIMKTGQVDLVILVDSPTFNLPLAKAAKKNGIKTLYYIAPQIWAWAESRWRRIRRRVDELAVILPFEQSYFEKFGIHARFVGHPFIYRIQNEPAKTELAEAFTRLACPPVLLMPGSRRHVVEELLPAQLRIVRRIQNDYGPVTVSIAAWKGVIDTIERITNKAGFEINRVEDNKISARTNVLNVFVKDSDRRTLIESARLVLAASGTGTLEVAWYGRPMIIMYNASKWFYNLIGRWLIKTKFLSLINILGGKEIVPEYMPYIRDESVIASKAIRLLQNKEESLRLGWNAQAIANGLNHGDPAVQVADIACDLIADKNIR